jgi:hypothetical protein
MDKHSSFLQKFANYGHKKFYNIEAWKAFQVLPAGAGHEHWEE